MSVYLDEPRLAPELGCDGCDYLRYRPSGAFRCMYHGEWLEVWLGDARRCQACLDDGRPER